MKYLDLCFSIWITSPLPLSLSLRWIWQVCFTVGPAAAILTSRETRERFDLACILLCTLTVHAIYIYTSSAHTHTHTHTGLMVSSQWPLLWNEILHHCDVTYGTYTTCPVSSLSYLHPPSGNRPIKNLLSCRSPITVSGCRNRVQSSILDMA